MWLLYCDLGEGHGEHQTVAAVEVAGSTSSVVHLVVRRSSDRSASGCHHVVRKCVHFREQCNSVVVIDSQFRCLSTKSVKMQSQKTNAPTLEDTQNRRTFVRPP
jgi:hypothetical protein